MFSEPTSFGGEKSSNFFQVSSFFLRRLYQSEMLLCSLLIQWKHNILVQNIIPIYLLTIYTSIYINIYKRIRRDDINHEIPI